MRLSSRQRAAFERDGYLVLERFTPPAACDALRGRAAALVAGFEPEEISVFLAHHGSLNSDAYFLESGDKIRFFFEEEAVDARGELDRPVALAVNKIGHALHDLDDGFSRFSRAPEVAELVSGLGLAEPLALQSMYIFKQPGIGGEVTHHQDATYLYTEPSSVIGLWWALEDASVENGCLWALPGGHRGGLKARVRRVSTGTGGDAVTRDVYDASPWPAQQFVPLEVPKGTLILLHGLLPHASEANRSSRSRHAYALHIIDGACRYPEDNWLRRGPGLPLRGLAQG